MMNLPVLLLVPIIYLIGAFAIFFSLNQSGPKDVDAYVKPKPTIGDKGEMIVAHELKLIADQYGGYLYNNVCFMNKNGFSSEIDHILLTQGGMFVIETKSIVGYIKGKPFNKKWISVAGKDVIVFNNPLLQNKIHIEQLRSILRNRCPKIMPLVVFPTKGSNTKKVKNNLVYDLESMKKVISNLSSVQHYTKESVDQYKSRLEYALFVFGISKEDHLAIIKRKHEIENSN